MTNGGTLPDGLLREFEQLDLSPYEARVLLALLRLGSANTAHLARVSGVPRTSTYQVLEELNRKGLAQRMSVDGPAVWASPGRDEVFHRLDALQEERLRQHRLRAASLREQLAATFPEAPEAAGPYVHVIQGAAQVSSIYDRLLGDATAELLVFNRPPYSYPPDQVSDTVLATVRRGVQTRVLYQGPQWDDPSAEGFREAMATYHRAGVEGRLVDELPIKLAIADRRVALLAMTDPVLPEIGFPTTLLVEHPGFAELQAGAFERLWESARPVETHRNGPVRLASHRPES
ncbi:MAG: TrmB family transcriptional regulator [Acidimicrobiales bacterium]